VTAGPPAAWVRAAFGYEVRDPALFVRALTHRSAGSAHNERLEFLGDAVLNLVTAQYLYERFPDADEGGLSRLRAQLVSGESLARIAAQLDLGRQLALGPGELKTGGFRRESILADAFEALIGALFLDGGLEAARRAALALMDPVLETLESPTGLKDPKTRLQEWLQSRGLPLPRYSVEGVEGELHAQVFRVSCEVQSHQIRTNGQGTSRRRAEQAAAEQVLELLSL
jgi:ribonuclease III